MKYNCDICKYSTNDKANYFKHKKTNKHLQNSNEVNKSTTILPHNAPQMPHEALKKYVCNYCNIDFSRSNHLIRHTKICKEKNTKHELLEKEFAKYKEIVEIEKKQKDNENKIKLLEEKLKSFENEKKLLEDNVEIMKSQYENHIETLKNENKFQKQLINSAGGMIKKSMNTMSYLLINYNNAPQLEALTDYSIISKNTETLIKDLIHYHKKGTFEKYIGDFIVKQYKKDNPNLQALWSSDIERLNYFIRELIKNKNDCKLPNTPDNNTSLNKKFNWTIDKKGIKVRNSIIDPLLDYIHQIGIKYLNEKNNQVSKLDNYNAAKLVNDMQEIGVINCNIKNKSISTNINKYIAPYFYLNKDLLPEK